jgi:DeoR family transcriptional regulator of aga operon
VVTCGFTVAHELYLYEEITTFNIGGEIHSDSHSVGGALVLAVMDGYKIRCTKALISANALSAEHGVTNRIIDRIPLKCRAMEISQQSIVMADGSKIENLALGEIAPITAFSILVTDASTPEQEITEIRALGVDVVIAE